MFYRWRIGVNLFNACIGHRSGVKPEQLPGRSTNVIATQADLDNLKRAQTAAANDTGELIPKFPDFPPDVVERFPSLKKWHSDLNDQWRKSVIIGIRGGNV